MFLTELVPRNLEELLLTSKKLMSQFPDIIGINVPDIKQLPIRSHDAASFLLKNDVFVIPHIRVQDRPLEDTFDMIHRLYDLGLTHVLLLSGDSDPKSKRYDVSVLNAISELKSRFDLNVYAALDPYRQSIKHEVSYIEKNFTQVQMAFLPNLFLV